LQHVRIKEGATPLSPQKEVSPPTFMSKALKRRKKSKISEKGKKSLNEQRIGKKWQKKLGRLCNF
jgi:hypothetical protein